MRISTATATAASVWGSIFALREEAVFKVDYQRNWQRDAFDNPIRGAAFLFSAATYF